VNVLAIGLNDHANLYNDHDSFYSKVAGYQLRVGSESPTGPRSGVLIETFQGQGVQSPPTVFIPIEHVPAEGEDMWIGFAPNWDTIDSDIAAGVCHVAANGITARDFPTLAMQAQGSDDIKHISGVHDAWRPQWQSFAGSSFGYGSSGEDQGAWFAGNLPWVADLDGGNWAVSNGALVYTGPGKLTLRMDAADIAITEPNEEDDLDLDDMGEPWSDEHGVRMGMRFKVNIAIDAATAGDRGVTMRWNDHSGWVETKVGFGDPQTPEGVHLTADGGLDSFGGDIVEDDWVCMWMDTRMVSVVRARAWNEANPTYPWSGETWRKLEVPRDAFFDHEDDSALEIIIEAGDGQQVTMDGIRAVGPGQDGQIVHEHAGSGDGFRTSFFASQPYYPGTMEFDVAGISVRAKDVEPSTGEFQSVSELAAPDKGRLDLTYRVWRERGYDEDDEDPTEDDSSDDEDYIP
jgi:hypothetical protein